MVVEECCNPFQPITRKICKLQDVPDCQLCHVEVKSLTQTMKPWTPCDAWLSWISPRRHQRFGFVLRSFWALKMGTTAIVGKMNENDDRPWDFGCSFETNLLF